MNNVSVTISLLKQSWSETGKVCTLTKEINEVEIIYKYKPNNISM